MLKFIMSEFLFKAWTEFLVTLRLRLWWFINESHMSQNYHETACTTLICTYRTHDKNKNRCATVM